MCTVHIGARWFGVHSVCVSWISEKSFQWSLISNIIVGSQKKFSLKFVVKHNSAELFSFLQPASNSGQRCTIGKTWTRARRINSKNKIKPRIWLWQTLRWGGLSNKPPHCLASWNILEKLKYFQRTEVFLKSWNILHLWAFWLLSFVLRVVFFWRINDSL